MPWGDKEIKIEGETDEVIRAARMVIDGPKHFDEKSKIRILFLSANPDSTTQLRVVEECNAIDSRIQASQYRDQFGLEQRHAVSLLELQAHLLRFKPSIVHFSGHGSEKGSLVFENAEGEPEESSPRALSALFKIMNEATVNTNSEGQIRVVVLNACYSQDQARAIAQHVDCVVGISDAIKDKSATNFAASFYQALAYGRSVKTAFELGRNQLGLHDDPDEGLLTFEHRDQLDPSKIFLAGADTTSGQAEHKRKKNQWDHCTRLLNESNLEEDYFWLAEVDINEDREESDDDQNLAVFKYGKQLIEHLYTGHRDLFDLVNEFRNSSIVEEKARLETINWARPMLISKLNSLGIQLDDWRHLPIPNFDEDHFERLIQYVLENSETFPPKSFKYKKPEPGDQRSIFAGDWGWIASHLTKEQGEKLASALNDFVHDNRNKIKPYWAAFDRKEKAERNQKKGFKVFFKKIALGSSALEGACEYCLSQEMFDREEIGKLRAELLTLHKESWQR